MSEMFHFLIKIFIKGVLQLFRIFPVDGKKIFLLNELSYTYGDSMKYIDQYLRADAKNDYEIVFAIKEGCEEPEGIKITRPLTFGYFKELISSGTIITNCGGVSYLPKRKRQKIINTWHGGGPYKKTGTDVYSNFWYKIEIKMNASNTDYILSSCRNFTEVEAKSMGFGREKCVPAGLPRNAILFGEHNEVVKKVRDYYSIEEGKKFILYAPTYRSSSDRSTSQKIVNRIDLDVDRVLGALREKYGCEWVCGIRLHPMIHDVDTGSINAINCSSYPDMQELLCCADAVIADYSSLIWDYSFTYRPIFLYAPDIDQYENERGFYMPVSEWPYPLARSNGELETNILQFDEEEYRARVREHHVAAESYETGRACEIVAGLIKE